LRNYLLEGEYQGDVRQQLRVGGPRHRPFVDGQPKALGRFSVWRLDHWTWTQHRPVQRAVRQCAQVGAMRLVDPGDHGQVDAFETGTGNVENRRTAELPEAGARPEAGRR